MWRLLTQLESFVCECVGIRPKQLFFYRKHFRIRNFGDELSPFVVKSVLEEVSGGGLKPKPLPGKRLFAIGSILHFASTGDVIWGSGVNGKVQERLHRFDSLDVRSVRGPLTREFLKRRGIDCPEVYGDPALLYPRFQPKKWQQRKRTRDFVVIPNYNDMAMLAGEKNVLSPLGSMHRIIRCISSCELVISTSLHGIILAEAFGKAAVLLLPRDAAESRFKYEDYYYGTGRSSFPVAESVNQALKTTPPAPPVFDASKLLSAFPVDFYYPKC